MWVFAIVALCLLITVHVDCRNNAAKQRTMVKKPKKVIVLITGCSSGIGEATALNLAADPIFKVWTTMRNMTKWNEEHTTSNMRVRQLDVTSEESVETVVTEILREDGRIDVLVNNAGYGVAGSVEMVSVDAAKDMFDVNVWGAVRLVQAVLPNMRRRGSGQIINMVGTGGIRGIPSMDMYTGSKFALEGIMDSMRYTLAPFNISITNINAAPVRSQFTSRLMAEEGHRLVPEDKEGYITSVTNRLLLGLKARTQSEHGQSSESVAEHIRALIDMRFSARRITDVPFNIGSNMDSQEILQEVRVNPTGWGGLYHDILAGMPPLKPTKASSSGPSGHSVHEEL